MSKTFLSNLKNLYPLITVDRVRNLMRTVDPVRAGTRSFQPSHLTLSRYYYFIFYSSFYLFFFSLLSRLLRAKPRLVARAARQTTFTHSHPRPSVFSHPLLPTHPSPVSHTPPPLDSASPRRHATFDFHAREDDDVAAAERRAKCQSKSLPYYFARQDRFLCTQR